MTTQTHVYTWAQSTVTAGSSVSIDDAERRIGPEWRTSADVDTHTGTRAELIDRAGAYLERRHADGGYSRRVALAIVQQLDPTPAELCAGLRGYRLDDVAPLIDAIDWPNVWPVVDVDMRLTGVAEDSESAERHNADMVMLADSSAWISRADAEADAWRIDDEGFAHPPGQ